MAAHADESHRLSTLDQETVDKLGDVKIGDGTLGHEKEFPPAPKTNYTMIQFFEWYVPGGGVHWKKYEEESARLADMGITAAWLPPPTKGSSAEDVGYGIMDLYDLGEFDQSGTVPTKYGTKEELLQAIKVAKENGIISYIDAVLNHRMGAQEEEKFLATPVDPNDRTKDIGEMREIKGWTGFTFPGRGDKYSKMKYNFNHFTGVDWDDLKKEKGIFRIQGDGKHWAQNVDSENKNYDFLMGADVDHAHPEVHADYLAWGDWVLKETGASGFRFDAIKHIDEGFIGDFVNHVRKEAANDSLFMVGEFWKDSFETINGYLDRIQTQFSLFDCPLHYNFKEAGDAGENYDLRQVLDGTIVQARPIDAVTLVDNHDTQVGQSLESWVSPTFKPLAYALILLRFDGYPCVFYGDLYGCGGENPQPAMSQLEDFIRARKLFSYGEQRDYFDFPSCIGWVRDGTEKHPDGCAVVMSVSEEGTKHMEIGKHRAGQVWVDVLGWHKDEVTIGEDGWADFKCPDHSVSIWVWKEANGLEEFKK